MLVGKRQKCFEVSVEIPLQEFQRSTRNLPAPHLKASELFLHNYAQPMVVLSGFCHQMLASEYQLSELVRHADIEWARMMGERPCLKKPGATVHPDDPYTVESVLKKYGTC